MYPSPHQWTTPSNRTPHSSMATQPPFSRLSNLPVQTHILLLSFQPYNSNVLTCAPLSSQLQFFGGTDFTYRPEHFLNGKKARTIYQLGPEPTIPDQKHISHVRRMVSVATALDGRASSCFNGLSEAVTQD